MLGFFELHGTNREADEDMAEIPVTTVHRLAARLEEDIRRRCLSVGDRYFTAAQAADFLGVSTSTAHRALAFLAEKKVLLRRHKVGTFVGPEAIVEKPDTPLFHFVIHEEDEGVSPVLSLSAIQTVRERLGGGNIQFTFVSEHDAAARLEEAFRRSAQPPSGVIAVSCPPDVYRYLAESKIPTVVVGATYAGQAPLPSIDIDQAASARLLLRYLLKRGHRRIVFYTSHMSRPGDNAFMDGLREVSAAERLSPDAIILRTAPYAPDILQGTVNQVLDIDPRPTAIILRSEQPGELAAAAVRRRGLAVPGDVEIVFQNYQSKNGAAMDHTTVGPDIALSDMARLIGGTLVRARAGTVEPSFREIIPVTLKPVNANGARNGTKMHPHFGGRENVVDVSPESLVEGEPR